MGELRVRCAGCAAELNVPAGRMAEGLSAARWTFVLGETRCPSCEPQESRSTYAPAAAATTQAASGDATQAAAPIGAATEIVGETAAASTTDSPYGRGAIARAERSGLNPDAALRARINAGVLDNIVVNLGWGVLRVVFGFSFASIEAAALFIGCQFAYFFLHELRSGSTPGKRRFGLTVVTLDGRRPGPRALAVRNALRVIDSFPIFYASGLLSLMRTGPKRRQRIGDVLAGTTVVSTDPMRQSLRTPRWLLPAACSFALLVAAAGTFGLLALDSSRKLSSADEANFVAGCSRSSGQPGACACVFETLRDTYGVDTVPRMQDYLKRVQIGVARRDPSQLPANWPAVAQTCRAQAGVSAPTNQ
jgi:uncharacterized RDD family membrane protein YckC